jgi:alpha-tubulin suppressor-like RCC1 family protein
MNKSYLLIVFLFFGFSVEGICQAWKQVSAGSEFSAAVNTDGSIWIWGFNGNGQLGLGLSDGVFINAPEKMDGITAKSIACGAVHTLALHEDGSLWAWGGNTVFQLGDNTSISKNIPVQIGNDKDWKAIAAGQAHNLAIKEDGSLWGWGFNVFGQVGNGSTVNVASPIRIGNDTDWVAIACGGAHSLALKSDGSLHSWGANFNGQLGLGSNEMVLSPRRSGNATWRDIQCGFEFSAGIRQDSTLWTWGFNGNGQLGDGTVIERNAPVQVIVPGISRWVDLSCGSAYTHAIASDSTLWGWGANVEGCLGISDMGPNVLRPDQVGSETDWIMIDGATGLAANNSVFGFHTLGMKGSRDAICVTGANYVGQLGAGDELSRNAFDCSVLPVTVSTRFMDGLTQDFSVYPNPFSAILWLSNDSRMDLVSWTLTDAAGKPVRSGKLLPGLETITTDNLSPGVYFLTWTQREHAGTVRLVKQ